MHFGRDVVEQLEAPRLDALGAEQQRPALSRQAGEDRAHMLGRRHHQIGGAFGQLGQVAGRPDAGG